MDDDLEYRRLESKQRTARRHLDQLKVSALAHEMAECRLLKARKRLEAAIIEYHKRGTTVSEIAERTGYSRPAIYKILHKHDALDSNTHKKAEGVRHAS